MVETTAATSGPDGSRAITLDPISTHKMQVEARRVESSLSAGFRVPWLSGGSGEGVDRHEAVEFEVDCGAGVGSPWLSILVTMPDGETRAEVIDVRPLVQKWVKRIVAAGPTGPWWYGQYPEGQEVEVWVEVGRHSGWWPGKVVMSSKTGITVDYRMDDLAQRLRVPGDEIPKWVRRA